MLLSSVAVGQALAQRSLLLTPEEKAAPDVRKQHHYYLALPRPRELDRRALIGHLVTDPALMALHRSILLATNAVIVAAPQRLHEAQKQWLAGGPNEVTPDNRKAVLSDPDAVLALHAFAWTRGQ